MNSTLRLVSCSWHGRTHAITGFIDLIRSSSWLVLIYTSNLEGHWPLFQIFRQSKKSHYHTFDILDKLMPWSPWNLRNKHGTLNAGITQEVYLFGYDVGQVALLFLDSIPLVMDMRSWKNVFRWLRGPNQLMRISTNSWEVNPQFTNRALN